MPQHWVGPTGSSRGMTVTALLVTITLAGGLVQLDSLNNLGSMPAQGTAADAALRELGELQGGAEAATALALSVGGSDRWETGTLAVPAEEPQVYLYVAHRNGSGWTVAIEGSSEFGPLAREARVALGGTVAADLLATAAVTTKAATAVRASGDGSASLSLPWTDGQAWRLTGGPHSNTGRNAHPWSSLDFAGPRAGMSVKVRAARRGIVVRPCGNLVQIRHSGGWTTSYYHLKNITVRAGQSVARGALLGYTSTRAKCGGSASGPHVHFSLMRYGSHVNIRGHAIGGWVVREGSSPYQGCLVRLDRRRCAPGGSVYNYGSAGADL